ncbi:NfeD family protein [Litoribacter populi]|uniref:NfeD family protein n=1 Tax=Litoribacter populi TaxID=2598460 RepID=UPI0011807EC6|nr:NfeD family protein [Litoribacter populi]
MKYQFYIWLCLFGLLTSQGFAFQEDSIPASKSKVFVFDIKSDIDPRMNRQVTLAMEEAKEKGADLIIIHMDTYGGAVNDADDIRTMVLESEIPIHVFIDKDAASAGALISVAADSIYMARGASIGAATVVVGGSGEAAPDKYQSYMRSMMRSTAEAKGRNPQIAEAMVDESIEIEGITKEGSVVTFSVSEAIEHGFCEAQVSNIEEIIEMQGITDFEIIRYESSGVEKVIAFFLNPAVSGFLILIIFAGIYFEIQTPGVGFPLAASVLAMILYFIPYYLTGLAGNWEILIFVVGFILLAVEIFVLPGFGVFGILGILGILAGLTFGMLPNDAFDFTFVSTGELFTALLTVILSAVISIILIFYMAPKVNQWKAFSHISLATTLKKSEGYTSSFYSDTMVGKEGVTQTRLMPSGKIIVDDELYDAYSRGEFIDRGEKIVVISSEGTSLRVKRMV